MRRLFNEVVWKPSRISKMIFCDERSLTSTFLISCKHKNPQDIILRRVSKFSKDFPIGIEPKGGFEGIRLIESGMKIHIEINSVTDAREKFMTFMSGTNNNQRNVKF